MQRSEHKGICGHGGINCACCRPAGMSKRATKRYSARITRRRADRAIRREASNLEVTDNV